jgi:preprotein translocase subunit SecG
MNKKYLNLIYTIVVLVGIFYLILPEDLLARAGGGGSYSASSSYSGSSSSGGSFIAIVIGWIATIFTSIIGFFTGMASKQRSIQKNDEARDLLGIIAKSDPVWNRNFIRARVEDIYFAVQDAWTKRKPELAKEYMSERIYKKHKRQIDGMIEDGFINKLERINLEDMKIIGVFDSSNDDEDRLKVIIYGGMIDYMLDETTNKITSGTRDYESFIEIWNFVRKNNTWVLDEIEQTVDSQSIKNAKVYSDIVSNYKNQLE